MWVLIGGVAFFCFGFWRVKKMIASRQYYKKHYSGKTTLRIVEVRKSKGREWDENVDGYVDSTFYAPVYEYIVDGKRYEYYPRSGSSTNIYKIGDERVGYYDPEDPKKVSEYRKTSGDDIFLPYIAMMAFGAFFTYQALKLWLGYYF